MYFFIKRLLDILISILALLILSPLLILISLGIIMSSGTPIFYFQERVGKDWKKFKIVKFRTMVNNADQIGLAVSSEDDTRVIGIGKLLRKHKLDELPQFFNVLLGQMSLIGPRPEILKYAEFYKDDYSKILTLKPGITDYASINFRNEAALLNGKSEGESFYLMKILPQKISLYKKYLQEVSLITDLKILFFTFKVFFKW
jgi:lipopolysaccharide/colanic/teichoic acid biosynthesis glycosyltransferase